LKKEAANALKVTPRELDVIVCVMNGLENREISKVLGISVKTVKRHIRKVAIKMKIDFSVYSTRARILYLAHTLKSPPKENG